MSDNHGSVAWTELMTPDAEAAKTFYGAVCGWSFETVPMMDGAFDYVIGVQNGNQVVGMMDTSKTGDGDSAPVYWLTYFEVDDVDAAVAKVRDNGGSVKQEPFDVPNVGRIAIVRDPAGAELGIMKAAEGG